MDYRTSMLSFIHSILARPSSPSSLFSAKTRKRARSPSSSTDPKADTYITTNTDVLALPPKEEDETTNQSYDREAAIASFLSLPDGPLVKRVKRGDEGSGARDRNERLSVIREATEEDYLGQQGDKDVKVEDIDLGRMEVEQGLWTYRGGNCLQR